MRWGDKVGGTYCLDCRAYHTGGCPRAARLILYGILCALAGAAVGLGVALTVLWYAGWSIALWGGG